MERVPGIELDKVWEDMPVRTRVKVVEKLAQYETAFVTCGLRQ
jgi:hypothetical protein